MAGWWFGWQRLLPTVNMQEPLKAHDMRHSLATIEAQGRPAEVQACAAIRKAIDYLGLVRQPTHPPTNPSGNLPSSPQQPLLFTS